MKTKWKLIKWLRWKKDNEPKRNEPFVSVSMLVALCLLQIELFRATGVTTLTNSVWTVLCRNRSHPENFVHRLDFFLENLNFNYITSCFSKIFPSLPVIPGKIFKSRPGKIQFAFLPKQAFLELTSPSPHQAINKVDASFTNFNKRPKASKASSLTANPSLNTSTC